MINQNDRIRVHPLYARMLKAEASLKGVSIKDLTLDKAVKNEKHFESMVTNWRGIGEKKSFKFRL